MFFRLIVLLVCSTSLLAGCSENSAASPDSSVDSSVDLAPDGSADHGGDSDEDFARTDTIDLGVEDASPDKPQEQIMTLYFKKPASWQSAYVHYWRSVPASKQTTWPGLPMNDEGNGWYSLSLATEQSAGIVFNDNGGDQTVDLFRVGSGYFVPVAQTSGKVADGSLTKKKWIGRWSDDNPDLHPEISVYPAGGNFYGDKVLVELMVDSSAVTAKRFTTDGSDPASGQDFANGQVVDLGSGAASGATITLRLFAATAAGSAERSFVFTKRPASTVEAWNPTNKPSSQSESGRWVTLQDFNNDKGLEPRNVTIYLPADYATKSHRRYRVVYFHDGQNLFSPQDAAYGQEWMLDEHYDELRAEQLIDPAIFVGIWSAKDGDTRTIEYAGGCGQGDARPSYAAWLIHSLKPYIDHHYRTRPEAEFTTTAGSSYGALISQYLAWNFPTVFGGAGCVSTAFSCGGVQMLTDILAYSGPQKPVRYWIDAGFEEGDELPTGRTSMVQNNRVFAEKLASIGWQEGVDLGFVEAVGQAHNETAWSHRIKQILYFLLRRQAPRVAHIDARTALDTLTVGQQTYASIDIQYENGLLLTKVFSDASKPATFLPSPPNLVDIDAQGQVEGKVAGTVNIEASYEGFTAKTSLTIQ